MPLELNIDRLVLGEASDGEDVYLFLLDPATGQLVGAAGYYAWRRYFECVDLVSDGYGPTLWLLLMQKARREGLQGLAPDRGYTSEQAKRMNARMFFEPPAGVHHMPNPEARHPEIYLNQIYFITGELVAEAAARRNAAAYFAERPLETLLPALKAYLLRAQPH